MRKPTVSCLLCLVLVLSGPLVRADSDIDLVYDIFSRGDTVMVWLDLSPFLTPAQVTRLNDGIDVLLQYDLRLAVPKRLWGDVTVARRQEAVRVSYHVVTKEYTLASTYPGRGEPRRFASLAQVSGFLADSVNTSLLPLDSLDSEKQYTLDLKITTITLTGFSPVSERVDSSAADSPLRFLFKKFLSLTGFGRREFETKSRPFSKFEILPEHPVNQ